jgi:hypothetical protein
MVWKQHGEKRQKKCRQKDANEELLNWKEHATMLDLHSMKWSLISHSFLWMFHFDGEL